MILVLWLSAVTVPIVVLGNYLHDSLPCDALWVESDGSQPLYSYGPHAARRWLCPSYSHPPPDEPGSPPSQFNDL